MSKTPLDILKEHWHYASFRPLQEEIIRGVQGGKDVLALLPTGGGKSLCYQVPALASPGLCLVISPLISLMKDQVGGLRRKNITAFALYAGMDRKEVVNTLQLAGNSNCKFLYLSPERLETSLFLEYLPGLDINLIAVDEAHCVSQWGYDFRPSYLRIAALREQVKAPVLALTASATPEVLDDIHKKLLLDDPLVFRGPFKRPNLSYSVFSPESKLRKVAEILQKVPGSSIIYCNSRGATRDISAQLGRMGFSAGAYHAGLSRDERSQQQENWMKDKLRVMVSTNAFGMGIDKSSVRTVIHMEPPESMESYYQESGRVGRDGEKAYAVLLASEQDRERLKGLPDLRYPAIGEIRPVYQQLMNYLQLPAGNGEGGYFDFDLSRFVDHFKCNAQTAMNVIKVLEQEGLVNFQQQVFISATVQFSADKHSVQEFERDHPSLQPLVEALLRTYEGILNRITPIREKYLAYLTRKDIGIVKKELLQLQAYRIIDYTPQKDSPQLYFFRDRPTAEDLYIDPVAYRLRKENFTARLHTISQYIQLTESCRSRYIAHYFGDDKTTDCGICDICQKKKSRP